LAEKSASKKGFFKKLREFFQVAILPIPAYLFIVILRITLRIKFIGLKILSSLFQKEKITFYVSGTVVSFL